MATYAVFSGINLLRGRQIDRYDYPLGRCALVLGGMIVSLLVARSLVAVHDTAAWMIGVPATIWLGWVAFLGYPAFRQFAQIPKVQAEV